MVNGDISEAEPSLEGRNSGKDLRFTDRRPVELKTGVNSNFGMSGPLTCFSVFACKWALFALVSRKIKEYQQPAGNGLDFGGAFVLKDKHNRIERGMR